MAVNVHSDPTKHNTWTGLSTDTKPLIGSRNPGNLSPLQNDLFFETDTGNWFIFANLAWKAYGQDSFTYLWQPSSLTWIKATADALGNLNVTLSGSATTSTNITQFGGTNISTGTGVSGAGIPRVTVSSDSFPASQAVTGTVTTTPPANASTNITQVAGTTLGATAVTNYGTAPAAAAVPGVNAFVTNTVAENLTQVASTVLGVPQTFGTAPTGVVIGTSADIYVAGTRARSNQTTTAAGVQDVNIVGSLGVTNSATAGTFAALTDNTTGPVAVKPASTAAIATDKALVIAISPNNSVVVTQATPASLQATVTPIALTKGTQGATGFSTQALNDAGRNTRIFMLDAFTVAPAVEAVQTVVQWYGNAAVAGTTQPAVVPAGKTLRLTSYKIMYQSLATLGVAVVRIRVNTAGLGVLASPLVYSFEAGSQSGTAAAVATAGSTHVISGDFPDGLEIPAASGLAFSMAGYGPTGVLTAEGTTRFVVFGYEY